VASVRTPREVRMEHDASRARARARADAVQWDFFS
jgi:hypothetical protein